MEPAKAGEMAGNHQCPHDPALKRGDGPLPGVMSITGPGVAPNYEVSCILTLTCAPSLRHLNPLPPARPPPPQTHTDTYGTRGHTWPHTRQAYPDVDRVNHLVDAKGGANLTRVVPTERMDLQTWTCTVARQTDTRVASPNQHAW